MECKILGFCLWLFIYLLDYFDFCSLNNFTKNVRIINWCASRIEKIYCLWKPQILTVSRRVDFVATIFIQNNEIITTCYWITLKAFLERLGMFYQLFFILSAFYIFSWNIFKSQQLDSCVLFNVLLGFF